MTYGPFTQHPVSVTASDTSYHVAYETDADAPFIVYPSLRILRLISLDTVRQQFELELLMHFTWHDPVFVNKMQRPEWQEEAKAAGGIEEQLRRTSWRPCVALENCDDVKSSELWFRTNGEFVSFRCRVHGIFSERFDLTTFPFDVQRLAVRMRALPRRVRFVEMSRTDRLSEWTNVHHIFHEGCCILAEWTLLPSLALQSSLTHPALSSMRTQYNELSVHMWVQRRWGYYVFNVFVFQCVIVLMTFCSVLVDPQTIQPRLAVSLTLLLTSVGVKYAVTAYLPKISYLTLLDRYMLVCFAMQALMVGENVVAKLVGGDIADMIGYSVLGAAFFLMHVGLLHHIRRITRITCSQRASMLSEAARDSHASVLQWQSVTPMYSAHDHAARLERGREAQTVWTRMVARTAAMLAVKKRFDSKEDPLNGPDGRQGSGALAQPLLSGQEAASREPTTTEKKPGAELPFRAGLGVDVVDEPIV